MTEKVGDQRFLLAVPFGASNPITGSGQRTATFFQALKALGPTHVVHFSGYEDPMIASRFEGAAGVHHVISDALSLPPARSVGRYVRLGRRLLSPEWEYGMVPEVREKLETLIAEHGITSVIFRFSRLPCLAGLSSTDALSVMVDVDDREDKKYLTLVETRGGPSLAQSDFARRRSERMLARVRTTLETTDAVWIAKPEDTLSLAGPIERVLRNVPTIRKTPAEFAPPSKSKTLLFVGTAYYTPNQRAVEWFLSKVWPLVHASNASARIRIVGVGNWNDMKSRFSKLPNVEFGGRAEDLSVEYHKTRAAIVPIAAGSGSQIKLIEACGYGRPVVTRSFSAHGFGEDVAAGVAIADSPEDFAAACLMYLADAAKADQDGARLQRIQQQQFSAEAAETQIQKDVLDILMSRQDGGARAPGLTPQMGGIST